MIVAYGEHCLRSRLYQLQRRTGYLFVARKPVTSLVGASVTKHACQIFTKILLTRELLPIPCKLVKAQRQWQETALERCKDRSYHRNRILAKVKS